MPLYTRVLTDAEYGVTDLIVQTGNLLLPLVSLGIINAVIRFGLDRQVRKSDVFTTGLSAILVGFCVMLLLYPLLSLLDFLSDYTVLIYAFVLMSSLRSLCSQFVRARGQVRLYAVDGIVSTLTTILFNVLFLVALGALFGVECAAVALYPVQGAPPHRIEGDAEICHTADPQQCPLVDHECVRPVYGCLSAGKRRQRPLCGGL